MDLRIRHREAREELKKAYNQKHLLLKESHHRIKNNLAIIHGIIELKSFETDDPDMSGFLKNLLGRLRSLAVGLIINEAFTNTVKYAFERTENPAIRILIERNGDRNRLLYRDNGAGIPEAVLKETQDRMGLRLIEKLAGQLSGTLTITGDEGTRIELDF